MVASLLNQPQTPRPLDIRNCRGSESSTFCAKNRHFSNLDKLSTVEARNKFVDKLKERSEMGLRKLWQYRSIVREAWDQTMAVATLLCGLHVTNTYLCTVGLAYGPSMLPTFNLTGDLFLVDRLSTMFGKVGRGDVVLVRSPENPRKLLAKRLLGMQGDSVTYVVDPKNSDRSETVVVPKGHVWIEGDNIYASRDSRQYGPVPYALVEGKIFWKIWPPKEFGSLGQSGVKDPDL